MEKLKFNRPTLLLVEHGQTKFADPDPTKDKLHGTKFDLALTAEGHQQARKVAETLKDFDIGSLKTSPMRRAQQTAEHIGKATGLKPEVDEGLTPLDSGYLSGMTHEAAEPRMRYYVSHPDKPIPEGQEYGDWWDKASERMAKRLKETEALHKKTGQATADVLHSSEIASMPAIVRGDGPTVFSSKQIPGSGKVSTVQLHGGKWRFTPDWKG